MIKFFTNAVEEKEGEVIGINSDYIISVFETYVIPNPQGLEKNKVTVLFAAEKGVWHVKEDIKQVIKILNEKK
jgi:hypothetical protein